MRKPTWRLLGHSTRRRARRWLTVCLGVALLGPMVAVAVPDVALASVVYASDSFNRTVSNGWGKADIGGTWSGTGSAFAVSAGQGTIAADSATEVTFLPSLAVQDVDVVAKITPPAMTSAYLDFGVAARYTSSTGTFYQLSTYFASGNNGGNYTVELKRKPANTAISPDFNTSIPGGSPVWLRLETQGTNPTALRWKIWADGSPEPSNWTATATDSTTAMQSSGGVGVTSYASAGTATFGFGNFTAQSIASPAPVVTCASTSIACDTFSRSASNGWGTADVGGSWSGTGPGFGVTPGAATLSADSTAPATFLPSASAQDVDVLAKISPPAMSSSYVDVGVAGRYQATQAAYYQLSAYYASGNNYGDYTAELEAQPGNVKITPNVNTNIPGGTAIWFRLQLQGVNPTTLRWKIWQDGSSEPGGWTSTATDSTAALQAAGGVGVKGYASSGAQTVVFNGLVANPIGAGAPPTIQSCPSGVTICDTFNRTVAGGWGSADTGGAWATSGAPWSVTPGAGTVVADASTPSNFLPSVQVQDVDAVTKVSPPGISSSYADAGLAVRYTAQGGTFYQLSAYYATGSNNGNYTVELKRKPDNSQITPDFATNIPGGTPFWLRLQAQGVNPTTLRWKIWADGTSEPSSWTGTATDNTAAMQVAGGIGLEAYVNAYTTNVSFNVLWASTIASSPGPPAFSCDPAAVACDTYQRTTSGWGNADTGGAWSVVGNTSNWSVSSGAGSINVPAGGQQIGFLGGVSVRDVDLLERVTLPMSTTGNTCDAFLLARYVGGASPTYYRVGLVQGPGHSTIVIRTQRNDGTYLTGDTDTGISAGPGVTVWLRLQVQGTAPTAVRARAWLDGTPEPTSWNVDTTDSTSALQVPGAVGIRVRNEDNSAPHTFVYRDFQAIALAAPSLPSSGSDLDTFGRTLTGTWGTADVGGAWSTQGSGYSVVPGMATINATSSTPTNFLSSVQLQDVDALAWVSPAAISSAYLDSGIAVRYVASGGTFYQVSAYYATGNNNGDYTVQLKRKPTNTLITPDFNTSIPGGTAIWIRLEAQGVNPTTLRWKIWQDGTPEPATWTGSATDSTSAMQRAGGVGVEAYANTGTRSMVFNRLVAGPIQ